MLDGLKHQLEKIGIFISGRTFSLMLAMGLASLGVIAVTNAFLITLPLSAALFGALDFLDYRFERDQLRLRYAEEIAAKTKKSPEQVNEADLKTVIHGDPSRGIESNPVLAEAAARSRKKHQLSFLTIAAVSACMLGVGSLAVFALGVTFAEISLVLMGATLLTDLVANRVVRTRAGVDTPTLHDRITGLEAQRGHVKEYTLFALAAEANPALARDIRHAFGAPLAKLPMRQKLAALERFSPPLGLREAAEAFNQQIIKTNELSFLLAGQASGVPKREPAKPLMTQARELTRVAVEKGKHFGHSVWMHLRTRNKTTGKEEDKLVICNPHASPPCVVPPEAANALLPLLEAPRHERAVDRFRRPVPAGFVERYRNEQASGAVPQRE